MSKRLFDIAASILGLVALLPVFVALAMLIKLDSQGPVFFRQERLGRFGRPFRIHKFRTMVWNADKLGRAITVGKDPRITRVGKFLRRSKLDEIPQLIDVLLGDMSLVGPRPELARYLAVLPGAVRKEVLSVRPGVTDYASIAFRNESDLLASTENPEDYYERHVLPAKAELNIRYIRTQSLWLDLQLICKTLTALVRN